MSRRTDLAWAAGFFEGEGDIYIPSGCQLHIGVYQSTDTPGVLPPTLVRFHSIVGFGKIERASDSPTAVKERWRWRCQRRDQAEEVLLQLIPYFTPGHRHAEKCGALLLAVA